MNRRGSVLMAVLLVVTIGALVAASVAGLSSAHVSAAAGAMSRARLRAAAWSGVQGVMAELADQRDGLLDGGDPELTGEWTITDPESGREMTVRLMPWDGEGGSRLAESEAGKLDLNSAPADAIAKLPGVGADLAAAVVADRPYGAVDELLRVEGITPELWRGGGDDEGAETVGLARRVTTHAFDPNVQHGVEGADEHAGRLRINLNTPWSERLGRDLDERFGEGTGDGVKAMKDKGEPFERPTDVVRVARSLGASAEDLVGILDAIACVPDQYVPGLVDLMHAPADVLACVPGIDASLADAIVSARASGSGERRWSPLWPVIEGLVELDDYTPALDMVSTRSLQWRVRIEAGYASERADDAEPELRPRIEVEAVVDVASERPRIAWLRETTMDAVAWRVNAIAPPPTEAPTADEPSAEWPEFEGESSVVDSADPASELFETDAEAEGMEEAAKEEVGASEGTRGGSGARAGSREPVDASAPRDNRRGRWTPWSGT